MKTKKSKNSGFVYSYILILIVVCEIATIMKISSRLWQVVHNGQVKQAIYLTIAVL